MSRKETLINGLRTAIDALKNDTIHYNWDNQLSCNMGVVAQAILEVDAKVLEKMHRPLFKEINAINKRRKAKGKEQINTTWKNAIKYGCPITGKNMPEIVNILESKGMSRADIVHLEYLENPAILELSGIKRIENVEYRTVPHPNRLYRLFGATKTEEVPASERKMAARYEDGYYSNKENVILYLSAWLNILTNENLEIKIKDYNSSNRENYINLEKELLHAVADEDYEKAADLRDKISMNLISV